MVIPRVKAPTRERRGDTVRQSGATRSQTLARSDRPVEWARQHLLEAGATLTGVPAAASVLRIPAGWHRVADADAADPCPV